MKDYFSVFVSMALMLYCNASMAQSADRLDCDPPFKSFGSGTPVMKFPVASGQINSGQSGEICTQISKTDIVLGIRCVRMDRTVPPEDFQCPLNQSCFGGGTFSNPVRKSDSADKDLICISFSAQNRFNQSVRASFHLK